MAVRPSWERHLRLSLVSCPVALYPATSERPLQSINPHTGNRIKMKTVDAGTGEDVSRGDLVKGFAVAKNDYVLLQKEDFARMKLESTRILDIDTFVPRESIDRLFRICPITWCRAQDRC
jgi:DNA end-binding protein Ku